MAAAGPATALPARAGRGNRMSALLADAAVEGGEGDAEFWDQEAWKEEAADEAYVSEKEEGDVFDSDFGESEARRRLRRGFGQLRS